MGHDVKGQGEPSRGGGSCCAWVMGMRCCYTTDQTPFTLVTLRKSEK